MSDCDVALSSLAESFGILLVFTRTSCMEVIRVGGFSIQYIPSVLSPVDKAALVANSIRSIAFRKVA